MTFQWGDPRAEPNWFDLDGDNGLPSSAVDVEFLTALRNRAMADRWDCDSEDTFGFHDRVTGEYVFKVGLRLADYEDSQQLMTFVLIFDGKRIYGDQVHDQTYVFTKRTEAALDFSGPLDQLVERAVEWFEWLLTWSIERYEWYEDDRLVSHRWVLSRTGRALWTNALKPDAGPPTKVVHVRGVPGQ